VIDYKFRAWDNHKIIHNVFPTQNSREVRDYNNGEEILIKVESIMQFTGLEDKNGKEIYYNSDIIKFKLYNEEFIGVFNFNNEEMRAEIDIYNKDEYVCLWYDCINMKEFEVIGNKFENSELLKGE